MKLWNNTTVKGILLASLFLLFITAVQRLIIFISEMVLGKRLASRQKNLQPDGLG